MLRPKRWTTARASAEEVLRMPFSDRPLSVRVSLIEDIYSLMINSCLESFMLVDVISSINSSGGGGEVLKTGPVAESVFEPSSSANTLTE